MRHTGRGMEHSGSLEPPETPETTGLLAIFGAFGVRQLLRPEDFDAFRAAISRADEAGETPVENADLLLNDSILACAARKYTAAVEAGIPAASFSRLGKRSAAAASGAGAAADSGRPAQRPRSINGGAS